MEQSLDEEALPEEDVTMGVTPMQRVERTPLEDISGALVPGWQRAAKQEQRRSTREEKVRDVSPFHQAVGGRPCENTQQFQAARTSVTPPTPADILAASSIRMMLGMAAAFRRKDPVVLQVLCSTLLDLLLETPPLVLAPIHETSSSIEAITFRRISEFCEELVGSPDQTERESALGLYLALAISRGDVSVLLKVVRCLLDRCGQAQLDVRHTSGNRDGTPGSHACSGSASPLTTAAAAGVSEPAQGEASGSWEARVSTVLDRLANHRVHLHLSFPDQCDGFRLIVRASRVAVQSSTEHGLPPHIRTSDQNIAWDSPAAAVTDGGFLFAWHPDFGLLKAGTGLCGTTKGRVYAQNSLVGFHESSQRRKTTGFVAVIRDTIFLQTGCLMPPHRFLIAQTSNLEVKGTTDVIGLSLPAITPKPPEKAEVFGCRKGDGERRWSGTDSAESVASASYSAAGGSESYTPLCSDGRLLYAIVPAEISGRPSVIAIDIANTGRSTGPAVELQRPRSNLANSAADSRDPDLSTSCSRDGDRRCDERYRGAPGAGGVQGRDFSQREWSWWRAGAGAERGVRMYCNGTSLVVCWIDGGKVSEATGNQAMPWRYEGSREESWLDGFISSPTSASGAAEDSEVFKTTRMVRFELATGECEPIVHNSCLFSGASDFCTPWIAYDSASNLILMSELRMMLPSTSSSLEMKQTAIQSPVEVCICLWRNRGLSLGALADKQFDWKGALRTLAEGAESKSTESTGNSVGHHPPRHVFPALRETAVFVLAHLDRLGSHYLGWGGSRSCKGGVDPSLPPSDGEPQNVPFCYDLSPSTFRHLVGLVETFAGSTETTLQGENTEKGAGTQVSEEYVGLYVLCASLRLLNVNVGILLDRGLGVAEFGGEKLRQSLQRCLLRLLRTCATGSTGRNFSSRANRMLPNEDQSVVLAVAKEALRLLVERVDLFYPSQRFQAGLLFLYLRVDVTNSECHTTASLAVMLEFLRRMSFLHYLRSMADVEGQDASLSGMPTEEESLLRRSLVYCEYSSRDLTVHSYTEALIDLASVQSVRHLQQAVDEGISVNSPAMQGEGKVSLSNQSSAHASEMGLAVMEALSTVLKLRCLDAFKSSREEHLEVVDAPAAFQMFLLQVLQAANDVLAAAVETRRSTTATCVMKRMAHALQNGLVGKLLPRCLASALVLLDEGGRDGPGADVANSVSQLIRNLRLLTMPNLEQRCQGEGLPSASPVNVDVEMVRGEVGMAARGEEGRECEASAVGTVGSQSKGEQKKEEETPISKGKPLPSMLNTTMWLTGIERLCASLGASMVRRLVMGAAPSSQEVANALWLRHPLLLHAEVEFESGEFGREKKASAVGDTPWATRPRFETGRRPSALESLWRRDEEYDCDASSMSSRAFVLHLFCRPTSRESQALSRAMKRLVLEDRGGDQSTNNVVWAASVAAIHHASVADEAVEVVRTELAGGVYSTGGTSKVTDAAVGDPFKVSSALVRAWRSSQQARAMLGSRSLPTETCALILQRAHFLLSLKPWGSTSRGRDSDPGSCGGSGVAHALRTSGLVVECLLSCIPTSIEGDDGAERDVISREGELDALMDIIAVQSERAATRARGLSLAVKLLDGADSNRTEAEVFRAVTDGLEAGCYRLKSNQGRYMHQTIGCTETSLGGKKNKGEHDVTRFHFMTGVECCDPRSKSVLVEHMARFLSQSSAIIGQERGGDRGADGESLYRRSVLVYALNAVSLDYEWDDHSILQRSQLLPMVFKLLDDADHSVAAAASDVVQALYRCAVPGTRVIFSPTFERRPGSDGEDAADWGFAGGYGASEDGFPGPKERKGRLSSSNTPFQRIFFVAVRHKVQDLSRKIEKETQMKADNAVMASSRMPSMVDKPDAFTADSLLAGTASKGMRSGHASGEESAAVGEKEVPETTWAAAQVLALAHACCRVECGRQELSSKDSVLALLRLVLLAKFEVRGWALRVCAVTLPWVKPGLVQDGFRSVVRERKASFEGSFIKACLLLVGKISGVWGRLGACSELDNRLVPATMVHAGDCMLDMLLAPAGCHARGMRESAREAFSLSSELTSLLHELVAGTEAIAAGQIADGLAISHATWQQEVAKTVHDWLRLAGPVVDSLQRQRMLEEHGLWEEAKKARDQLTVDRPVTDEAFPIEENVHRKPLSLVERSAADHGVGCTRRKGNGVEDSLGQSERGVSLGGTTLGTVFGDNLGRVVAVLCLLGGHFDGLYPGARVVCRLPPEERHSDVVSRLDDHVLVEATVLRLGHSGSTQPRSDFDSIAGNVDTVGEAGTKHAEGPQQAAVQAARPVFSSRLVQRPPGFPGPLDIYERSTADTSGTVARDAYRADRDHLVLLQQHLAQQHQDISRRLENARLGSVSRRHGSSSGWAGMGRGRGSAARESTSGLRNGGGGGNTSAPFGYGQQRQRQEQQQQQQQQQQQEQKPISKCKEFVTVGVSRGQRKKIPQSITIPIENVALVHEGLPEALIKTLLTSLEEVVPGLRDILGADTEFRGPMYGPLESTSDCSRTIESAHPYERGKDCLWTISFKGSDTIEVSFDPMSEVAHPHDHIALSWRTRSGSSGHRRISPCSPTGPILGRTLADSDGEIGEKHTWPGVGADPPLVIMTDELTVRFVSVAGATIADPGGASERGGEENPGPRHTMTTTRGWGFRLTARGRKGPPKSPPAQPPSQARAILCDLRARLSVSLATILEHGGLPAGISAVLPSLAKATLRAASEVAVESVDGNISRVANAPAQLERRLSHAYDLLHEQPRPPARLPESDFVHFPLRNDTAASARSEPVGVGCTADDHGAFHHLATPATGPSVPEENVTGIGRSEALRAAAQQSLLDSGRSVGLCPGGWPKPYTVCVGGVWAFDNPEMSAKGLRERPAERLRLKHGATVMVVEQQRDWLKLVYDPLVFLGPVDDGHHGSTCPSHVWAQQRQDDTIFLLPEALVKDVDLPAVADYPDTESAHKGVTVAMYQDEDSAEGKNEDAGDLVSTGEGCDDMEAGVAICHGTGDTEKGAIARGDQQDFHTRSVGAVWGFTIDTLCTATARNGASALLAVAKSWCDGPGKPSLVDLFGSVECVWEFLRLTSVVEKGKLQSPAMTTLWQRVRECVAGDESGAVGRCLVGYALSNLQGLAAKPNSEAVAHVFETPHPYHSMMDMTRHVHLPGAERVKIVFDQRSRTKNNGDWVEIHPVFSDSSPEARKGLTYRFHGRRGHENFPGFGGRPPLWFEGNQFAVRFHSDSSTTDWGVRFTAYGILGRNDRGSGNSSVLDVATAEPKGTAGSTTCEPFESRMTVPAAPAPTDGCVARAQVPADTAVTVSPLALGGTRTLEVELCCWLLECVRTDCCRMACVASRLYDKGALKVFEQCLRAFHGRCGLLILRLISGIVSKVGATVGSQTMADDMSLRPSPADIRSLLDVVLSLIKTQPAGKDQRSTVPSYLRGLVECAVVLRAFLVNDECHSGSEPVGLSGITSSPRLCRTVVMGGQAEGGSKLSSRALAVGGSAARDLWRGIAAVQEIGVLWPTLLAFSRGTTPVRLLLEYFLPMLTETCSVAVQSNHPAHLLAQRRFVVVPGAKGMQVRFDHRTEMREDDRIMIRDLGYHQNPAAEPKTLEASSQGGYAGFSETEKETLMKAGCNLVHAGSEISIVGLTGGTEESLPPVSIGDHVIRGPDWVFGDEDHLFGEVKQEHPNAEPTSSCGWPGTGVVIALERWGEREDAGARVRWDGGRHGDEGSAIDDEMNEKDGRGKWFEALYSVQNPAHIRVVKRGGANMSKRPVITTGNAVEVAVGGGGMTPDAGRKNKESQHSHLFYFDGRSTHIDLPCYRGMRLESDFTLEVWAWLDVGVAKNGKQKCVFSRTLHQPFRRSRRIPGDGRPHSWRNEAGPTPSFSHSHLKSPREAMPPSTGTDQAQVDAADSSNLPGSSPPQQEISTCSPGRVQIIDHTDADRIPRDTAVVGNDMSPIDGERLVCRPTLSVGDTDGIGVIKLPKDCQTQSRLTGDEKQGVWERVGPCATGTAKTPRAASLSADKGSSRQPLLFPVDGCGDSGEEGPCHENNLFLEGEGKNRERNEEEMEKEERFKNEEKDDESGGRKSTSESGRISPVATAGSDQRALEAVAFDGPAASRQDGGVSKADTVVGSRRLDGSCPPDGDNPTRVGLTKAKWDGGHAKSYETGANDKHSICSEDAVPGTPQDVLVSVTDRSITIRWSPPARLGCPELQSYIIYRGDAEIASVGSDTLHFTNDNRAREWLYGYSVAARGPAGTSPSCPAVATATAAEQDSRTQLALCVGRQGEIEFEMGNERGKGVTLAAGEFQEGVWTHLAVSVEGRKVSVFVNGEHRASGCFTGLRLCSDSPSPIVSELPSQRYHHSHHHHHGSPPAPEPLRLGSRGTQDFWQGLLCEMRVWGAASQAADVRRRISSLPSANLVRPEPMSSFGVTVPATEEVCRRFRFHAPLAGSPELVENPTPWTPVRGQGKKAYYEVILRSGGCMQIGWGLPSSCLSTCNQGIGDDDYIWAIDGMRSTAWHGNASPTSSPHSHGLPYGDDWKWNAGDVIGCAVDLDAGVMSFSHNGRNLGDAFTMVKHGGTMRYRVIAPTGLECREGVNSTSRVVEFYPPGTVLKVSRVENMSSNVTWRLRTAQGWVAERNVNDPDEFYLERLEHDTCDLVGDGVGSEHCVFVDVLRMIAETTPPPLETLSVRERNRCGRCCISAPHGLCKDIVVRESYAEVRSCAEERTGADGVDHGTCEVGKGTTEAGSTTLRPLTGAAACSSVSVQGGGHDAPSDSSSSCRDVERLLPTRSLLTNGVEIGDAEAVTFVIDLFVPARAGTAVSVEKRKWTWGVIVADVSVYLTTQCYPANTEKGNSAHNVFCGEAVAPGHKAAEGRNAGGGPPKAAEGLLRLVIDGPDGVFHTLPVCAAYEGRWMTLKIVAHRSGESLLVCSPGTEQVNDNEQSHGFAARPRRGVHEDASSSSHVEERGGQQQQLRCRFSSPHFFREDRIGRVGLYSERSAPHSLNDGGDGGYPCLARHAVILLGSLEEQPPPGFPRLCQLQRLLSAKHAKRSAEPATQPLLFFSRQMNQLWSGEVTESTAPLTTTGCNVRARTLSDDAGDAHKETGPKAGRAASPILTVWQPLLSARRVAFGTTVDVSRSGSKDGGEQGRSLLAWEHPALQTPARFEPVPLPKAMATLATHGRGLWAWAPVPRSEAFLAIGLTFTGNPKPPSLTDVRCVRKELVIAADPQKCKVVTLQQPMSMKRHSESNDIGVEHPCCEEVVLVKEMGMCVPKEGSKWGLSPRVVLGNKDIRLGRRQLGWDGLMPSINGTAGQGMLVNLGDVPFRHSMEGYTPVSEMAHVDARFVLQVYDYASRIWQDVQPGDGLMDVSTVPRPPELIGSWMLASGGSPDIAMNDERFLKNDVFIATTLTHTSLKTSGERSLVRLPPARVGGKLEGSLGRLPAPTLRGAQEVWGFSLKVYPIFPSELGGAHPWLSRRFEAFSAHVWGEEGRANASNIELVRCVNAIAARKGLSKEKLLSCDWAALRASCANLAEWPLLQSMESQPGRVHAGNSTIASLFSRAAVAATAASSSRSFSCGGVEETKQNDTFSGTHQNATDVDPGGRRDEWIVSPPNAPTVGVKVRQTPVENGKVIWRLLPGQIARLLPSTGEPAKIEHPTLEAGGTQWRSVRGVGGQQGWLALPQNGDRSVAGSVSVLEHFWADRVVLDSFSSEVSGRTRAENSDSGDAWARKELSTTAGNFWLPIRREGSMSASGARRGPAEGPSPLCAAPLDGDSDSLFISNFDADALSDHGGKGEDDGRPLLVAGKWKVGLVTDTLTVATRTSGCTRMVGPSVATDCNINASGSNPERSVAKGMNNTMVAPLPVLVDGLIFGFRAVDGLLIVTRALPVASRARGSVTVQMEPVERHAVAWLGGVEEGAEVSFSIMDNGRDVVFSCQEVGSRQRAATVRAKCGDSWGSGRVTLGARRAVFGDSTSGWVRVTSQAHGATVRSGVSIDGDAVVGRIPCGTVVPYDRAILYHSPGAPDRSAIDPVVRYRCMATVTTPAGWISERGRYADHPYRICEQVRARPQQPPASVSHVSVARVQPPIVPGGKTTLDASPVTQTRSPQLDATAFNRATGTGMPSAETLLECQELEWQLLLDDLEVLPMRFQLLQQLNQGVSRTLRYIDLSQGDLPESIAGQLSRSRHLVFTAVKQELWQDELTRTSRPLAAQAGGEGRPPSIELLLSRGRAAQPERSTGRQTWQTSHEGKQTLFGQAFSALRTVPAVVFRLRPEEALYSTVFLGEHAHDAGGPYRESFAEYCAELQSGVLPLLIKCPNAVNDVGINREKWVPNPAVGKSGLSRALHSEMLGFLGRLMGVAIRSQEPLDLDLPSIVWKQLVRSPITRHDLEAIDYSLVQSLSSIRDVRMGGMAEAAFLDMGLGGFQVTTADGRRVDLPTAGGASREVTQENRHEFADMVEAFKLQEYQVPVEAIHRGLACVIPIEHLRLFSWDELEVFVCGRKEVDIDLLEACTEYALCCRQDSHVSAFWDVLRSFSSKERSLFLRFAWGRSRLPTSVEHFHQHFKIQAFSRVPADAYLPVAHTCFFSLELPRYSSREVLEEKLRYAISHCRAVDTDDTSMGRNAAGLGWGRDP